MATEQQDQTPDNELIQPLAFAPLDADAKKGGFRLDPARAAIGITLLSFAAVLGFIFTAKSVQFQHTPEYAQLDISGGIAVRLGNRYLMRSGSFDISLAAPGYRDLAASVEVGDKDTQVFSHTMVKTPGLISINSTPAGARLAIDGEARGVLPVQDLPVEAGSHQLSIAAERYQSYREMLEVTGMDERQSLDIELLPAWADITVTSEPSGATLTIDGEPRGTTPITVEVLEGEHELGIELQHHQSWQQSLEVIAGKPQDLGILPLLAADGYLRLVSQPTGANVTVDGEFRGQTPITIALRPNRGHRLAVFKPGYRTRNTTLEVAPDQEKSLNLSLQAQLGKLRVSMSPADAELIVNGKSYGATSQTLEIPAFEQTLEVRKPGYRTYRQRITPRPGFEQALRIALKTESEARLAELPAMIKTSVGQSLKLFTPGSFTMGASRREPGRRSNEVLRPVELTRLFYLGLHEVTNADYRQFKSDFTSGQVEGNSMDGDRQPAIMLSWEEAATFCNWLSAKEELPLFYRIEDGRVIGTNDKATGYRLPTEAEWAWAARTGGSDQLKYPWGPSLPPSEGAGNYADASSSYITGRTINNYDDGFAVTAPVGSFDQNPRGLYDMGGNVAEWTNDYYAVTASSGVIEQDPTGPSSGENRVIRGSSWAHGTVTELRLSYRDYDQSGRDDVGFRVARYAEVQ